MSIIRNYKTNSLCDGLELGVTVVLPETEMKGILQLSHGMAEYRLRYLDFMKYMADRGYLCVIHDHRGHGESVRSKEDYGYFYEDGSNRIVEDLNQITEEIQKEHPELPHYLFGHSMGTLVARKFLQKYDSKIDGLILCGPPTENKQVRIGKFLVHMMTPFYGSHYRSKFIQKMAFGSYGKRFKQDSNPSWLCSSLEEVKKYQKHEACGFIFTLNGFENLFSMMEDAYKKEYLCENPKLPILMIAGSDDPVIGNENAFLKTKKFLQEQGYQSVQTKLYPGKRHELLNEDNKLEIYDDILHFLETNDLSC